MKLTIQTSASCPTCEIGIEQGISSSIVTLSRDILGKIDGKVVPASNKWVWDDRVEFGPDGVPRLIDSPELRSACSGESCKYLMADPSTWGKTFGNQKVDDKGYVPVYGYMLMKPMFEMDLAAWRADQQLASKKKSGKKVRMWNPSDDPDYDDGSQAINYQNHGALTKLFLKPTLPFNVTFSS